MTELTQEPIALLDLAAERRALEPGLSQAVERVLDSGRFVLGPEVERFEAAFAALHGVPHGVGVASGTDALILALKACGLGPGDGVITSSFSFFASAAAIAWIGARPVLVDVEEHSGLIDPEAVERALADARIPVRCLLPVHLYGRLADMRALGRIAERQRLFLIEDAAQAHGAERDGYRAGQIGDLACFSFYPTKNLGCAGDGGMVIGRDGELAARLRRLRDHGSFVKYEHLELGTNSRLAALQAAILDVKLPHLEAWNQARRARAAIYQQAFDGHPRLRPLEEPAGSLPVHHQYALRVPADRRASLQSALAAAGISTAVHYPCPIHRQPAAREWTEPGQPLARAERLAREVLCLPIHPFLGEDEVERVARTLLELA